MSKNNYLLSSDGEDGIVICLPAGCELWVDLLLVMIDLHVSKHTYPPRDPLVTRGTYCQTAGQSQGYSLWLEERGAALTSLVLFF